MRELTPEEIQEALDLRRDGQARAWGYQCSHSWFTLRITSPRLAGNFHLLCGACSRVEFDMHWERPEIRVERVEDAFLVHDREHLRIRCHLVCGRFNVPPLFE
jgi:hypothetical protein